MNKLNQLALEAINHPPAGGALLDSEAAASFLNLSSWTLAEWRCTGAGPRFVKVGRLVRYTPAALTAWIESRTVASTSEHDAKKGM
jgi:predicted DNA-binding transcriptional regulator AlpA